MERTYWIAEQVRAAARAGAQARREPAEMQVGRMIRDDARVPRNTIAPWLYR